MWNNVEREIAFLSFQVYQFMQSNPYQYLETITNAGTYN